MDRAELIREIASDAEFIEACKDLKRIGSYGIIELALAKIEANGFTLVTITKSRSAPFVFDEWFSF